MLDDVKLLLGFDSEDTDQDNLLRLLNQRAKTQVLRKLKNLGLDKKIVPEELEYIVTDLTIIRYNRIGSEGIQSESVEGYSAVYNKDDLSHYEEELQEYVDEIKGVDSKKRIVRFI